MLDGELVCSCLVLGASAADSDVRTIEGYGGPDGELTEVQVAFIENSAVQCGFCTPGLIVAIEHLLEERPEPTDVSSAHGGGPGVYQAFARLGQAGNGQISQ